MSDKVDAIGANKDIKKNRWENYQERLSQYAANFQAPDKMISVFTANPTTETKNTVFGG